MEKVKSVGSVLVILGVLSFLLSLVNLQFKALGFLGEYKIYVEIGSVVIGLLLILFTKVVNKSEDNNQN